MCKIRSGHNFESIFFRKVRNLWVLFWSPGMLHLPLAPFSPFKAWMQDMWQKKIKG